MGYPIRGYVAVVLVVAVCFGTGCKKKEKTLLPEISFTPLPKQAAVALDATNVDKFVDWVSTMPGSQTGEVRDQIALVKADPNVVDEVASRLSFTHPGSYGRQLIYLSILGEMKNERAFAPLKAYLYSRECPVFEERIAAKPVVGGPRTSHFDGCAGLKSAAVNMLAYLNAPAAKLAVLDAVHGHVSRSVRLSAMNAYLYNEGDSQEALAAVRQRARPGEVKFVGLPRLTAKTDAKEFEDRLARFYEEYPEERAPMVTQLKRNKVIKPKPAFRAELATTKPGRGDVQ